MFCSLKDRLAVINLLHEARGLDTFPVTLRKLEGAGDVESIKILNRNFEEEVYHVTTGVKWFKYLCEKEQQVKTLERTEKTKEFACNDDKLYIETFLATVRKYYTGKPMKGPFNVEARNRAGLTEEWYMPLTQQLTTVIKCN